MKQLKLIIKLCLVTVMLLCQTNKSILNVHGEADTEAPVIDVSSLKVDKTEAIAGDKVTISMRISDNIAVNHATIKFKKPQSGNTTSINTLTYNSVTGLYEYVFNVTDETASGIWQIFEIYATDTSDNYSFIYNSNVTNIGITADLSKGNFSVSGTHADIEEPVIDVSSLKVDKTEAIAGDKVTISMRISDNIAVNHATIKFKKPQSGNTTSINTLTYNSVTGLYEYVFNVTDETASGIWQIFEIYATDTSDNYSFIYNSNVTNIGTTADLNKGNFRVFASQADLDEYNTYQKVSSVSGATAFYTNATVSNKTIDGDVWIGPNALVTLSNVIVAGNIYVLGGLKAQSVTANEIFAHEFLHFSSGNYTYSNGTVSLSGTCSISSLKASTYLVESIPINIQSELTSLDDVLELKGSTLGVADFSIDGESVSLYDNEKFIKTINVAGRDKITFSWKTVFGNTITKEYSIDKLYTAPNGKKSHYSQISTTSSINLIIGQPYDLAKYITVTDQEDGENEYKSIDIDSSAIHIDKVGSYTITVKVTDQDNLVSTKELTVNVMQPVASVSLNKADLTLSKGNLETLAATVSPSDSSNKNVTWSSSDETIATVDQTGKVTALKAGTTTITATTEDGRKTAACNVTVTQPVTGISLNKTDLTMTNGGIEVLTATVEPEDSSNNNVTWSSSDPTVAKVDQSGKVTALKAGTTTITVTTEDGNKTATCHVTVTQPVTNISLNKTDLTLTNGDTETLVATVTPENASNKNVTWSSGDESVATVDQAGKVTALKAGTTTITVTTEDGKKTATCTVTITDPVIAVTGIMLNQSCLSMNLGVKMKLTATVLPETATNKIITWSTDDPSVATVENGTITALKTGIANITATTDNGKTATCTVTVQKIKEEKITDFVTTLYSTTLDRTPDAGGLSYWVNILSSGKQTGSQVVHYFIFGPEFTAKNYCNEHFLTHLYKAIFSRDADTSGLTYWENKMSAGTTREAVLNGFLGGKEFKTLCSNAGISVGTMPALPAHGTIQTWTCPQDNKMDNGIGNFVLRMYTTCLGRDAEKEGASYWISQLNANKNGGTFVAEQFFLGTEFTKKNYSNTEYVTRLYRTIFGREPEAGGLTYWTGLLDKGTSRKIVLQRFTSGTEWSDICKKYRIKK